MKHPKFDAHLKDQMRYNEQTRSKNRQGAIMSYDKYTNTASVLLSAPDSDEIGDLITGVMCPIHPGLQLTSPEPGTMCWVEFRDTHGDQMPIITHFFNHRYAKYDYSRQANTKNGIMSYRLMM
jgi:hypothetical protein